MWRIVIYIIPVFINMMLGGMFYICSYRMAEAGYSKLFSTCTVAVWSVVYCLFTLVMGRITTVRRAPGYLIASSILLALSSLGCVVFPHTLLQFLWLGLVGIGIAGYCTPFQIFAKELETSSKGGVSRATAGYNISWSLGMAAGPSLFGLLDEHWQVGYYVNAAMSVAMTLCVLYLLHLKRQGTLRAGASASGGGESAASEAVHEYSGRPDLVYVGWISIGLGAIYIAAVRALEPIFAQNMGLGQVAGGLIVAAVSYTQVAGFILLIYSRKWMYGVIVPAASSIAGVAGMLVFAFCTAEPMFYLAAILIGTYSTIFYFMGVFHSLVHPTKSVKYIACNETLVGISGVIGSIGGGWLADRFGFMLTFVLLAFLAVVSVVSQLLVRGFIFRRYEGGHGG